MLELVPCCRAARAFTCDPPSTGASALERRQGADEASETRARIEAEAGDPEGGEIVLATIGGQLQYHYDLRPLFDAAMWKLIEETGSADLLVEVRVVDAAEAVVTKKFHHLTVTVDDQAVTVRSGARSERRHSSRAAFLEAIRKVPGGSIGGALDGNQAYLDLVVLVNPVQVFDVDPTADDAEVGQRVVFDRRHEARSGFPAH